VETDAPCEVEVLGHGERTFTVAGHHYALVRIENLRRREVHPYDVRADGRRDPEGREFDALYRLGRELLGRPRAPTCCKCWATRVRRRGLAGGAGAHPSHSQRR
jgi:hypothetical protein